MSAADVNRPIAMPERVLRVMRLLTVAAEKGARCPTNGDIADVVGANTVSAGANAISLLESLGLISVERFANGREVTITATGKTTAGFKNKSVHWSRRGVTPIRPQGPTEPCRIREPEDMEHVDRDPCGFCGTRRDIGCHHTRMVA